MLTSRWQLRPPCCLKCSPTGQELCRTGGCSCQKPNISQCGLVSLRGRGVSRAIEGRGVRGGRAGPLQRRTPPPLLELPGRIAVTEARMAVAAVRQQGKARSGSSSSVRSRQPVHLFQHGPAIAFFRPRVTRPGRQKRFVGPLLRHLPPNLLRVPVPQELAAHFLQDRQATWVL